MSRMRSYNKITPEFVGELEKILGAEYVHTDAAPLD